MDSEHPKVLISYSHDSPEHQLRVLQLSERLRADGIDARIDQYEPWPKEGWPRWMERHLREADFVLMVCTETYNRRVTGQEEPGSGRGVCWEATFIYNDLYGKKITTAKYVPLFFDATDEQYVPAVLQGHARFCVLADRDYGDLYRLLTSQPPCEPGKLGPIKKLLQLEALQIQPAEPSKAATDEHVAALPSQTETKKCFISYPHGDPDEENLARYLHGELTNAGHEVFIDVGMKAGSDWVSEIRDRIDWCDYLLVLLAERSMHSEMVQTEVRLARLRQMERGEPQILPIRVRYPGVLEYELAVYLGHLQYATWNGPKDSARILEQILDAMGSESAQQLPLLPEQQPESEFVGDQKRPLAARNAQPASVPGGTIRHSDPFYITRPVDDVVTSCAPQLGQTLVIKGPRQMGKSSLLLHYLSECQNAGKQIGFVDFQIFSHDDLASYPAFLSRFAMVLGHRLRLDLSEPPAIDSQFAMVAFLESIVLPQIDGAVVIALDEADRLFGQDYKSDFFSMLRVWHNNRVPLTPEWEDVDLALVISTEPYLLIEPGDRSPFNVGLLLNLNPFTRDECRLLNKKYLDLLSENHVEQLWSLLRGHPYLTRLAYYRLTAPDKVEFHELLEKADDERGPFGDHLRALLMHLHEKEELLDAMKQVILTGTLSDKDLYYRLYGAGLVRQEGNRINPANLLYARYFKSAL